jgi:Ras association domain-containing protein 2/4
LFFAEQRKLKDDEYPLVARVMLGPHEEVVKLFLMDAQSTQEISCEVAQFLNFSSTECKAILDRFYMEEENEVKKIKAK